MIEITVLGQLWKVYLQEEERYVQRWGDSDAAHTIPSQREIWFNEAELCRVVVTHELCHSYYAETCTISAQLSADQTEEVMCEMFGQHGNKILNLSRKLYKELKDA